MIDTVAMLAYQAAGLCVLPARYPEKRPAIGTWKDYQARLPTAHEVAAWFANPHQGLCLICGAVSGNLELLDFDCAGEAFDAWSKLVVAEAPGLLERLVIEGSPSGGWHVVARCAEPVSGNLKLAQRREDFPSGDPLVRFGKTYKPRQDKDGRWHIVLTLIETRGEGGLFLCAPTPGYTLLQGEFTALPVITAAEREILLRCAWALNQVPPEVHDPQPATIGSGLRPGDDFNRRGDVAAMLQHHGWTLTKDGVNQHWTRPGKSEGTSATLKDGVFYVFSSNAQPFEPNHAYSPFAAFALLEHHSDHRAAAAALRQLGYGEQLPEVDLSGLLAPTPVGPFFDLRRFADTPERVIDWIWPGVIPRGMVSLIGGKQGLGKSFLICDLAARVSAGMALPDGTINPPGQVLLLAREDDAGCVLLPRLRASSADLGRVSWSTFSHATNGSPLDLVAHVDGLTEVAKDRGFALIVVDTFAAFAPVGTDANAAQDVRLLLDALNRLARATGAAVVVVAHLRKTGQGDGDPMDAIAGSVQMTAGVRVASLLDKGVADGDRWFRVVKSNLRRIDETGWTWRFHWPDPFTEGAADMPRLAWGTAGEEYVGLDAQRQTGSVIDLETIRRAVLEVLAKGPRSHAATCDLVFAQVRREQPRLRKADVELAIDDLSEDPSVVQAWEGPRGARMLGLPGSRAETPDEVAIRLAEERPDLTVRELRALASCSNEAAITALRVVRRNAVGSVTDLGRAVTDCKVRSGTQEQLLPGSVTDSPARPIGRGGSGTGTGERGGERY
jgi:hypothetical protein